jgi:hypothetical protein
LLNEKKGASGFQRMKYWEIVADNLGTAGRTWGYLSHVDSTGRVLFTADAHRDNEKEIHR